jgi:hypothetical protein
MMTFIQQNPFLHHFNSYDQSLNYQRLPHTADKMNHQNIEHQVLVPLHQDQFRF